MTSVVGVIGAIAAVVGATFSFAILRRQQMATRESVRSEIVSRGRNVRYLCEPITADLRRVVVTERDGLAYELKRLFRGIEGTTELLFAIQDLNGDDVQASKLDFDEDRLDNVLDDLLMDASLEKTNGLAGLSITLDTADPDVADRVGQLVPHHLLNQDRDVQLRVLRPALD